VSRLLEVRRDDLSDVMLEAAMELGGSNVWFWLEAYILYRFVATSSDSEWDLHRLCGSVLWRLAKGAHDTGCGFANLCLVLLCWEISNLAYECRLLRVCRCMILSLQLAVGPHNISCLPFAFKRRADLLQSTI
jgi:hypothetical protein